MAAQNSERLLLLAILRRGISRMINTVSTEERECWERRLTLVDKWREEVMSAIKKVV